MKKGWMWFGGVCLLAGTFFAPFWSHHPDAVKAGTLAVEVHIPGEQPAQPVAMSMPIKAVRPMAGTLSSVPMDVELHAAAPVASSIAAPVLLTDGQLQFSQPRAIPAESMMQPATVVNAALPATVARTEPINSVSWEMGGKVPVAWVVRVGSFNNELYAKQLVGHLRVAGFEAYMRTLSAGVEVVYPVYIGPEIDRARISAMVQKLKKQFSLDGVVERYAVEAPT